MHLPIPEQGRWLASVLSGHYRYYAVPDNIEALAAFRKGIVRHWLKALRRRSQRHRLSWQRMRHLADRWLPQPRILHPWPEQRFAASTEAGAQCGSPARWDLCGGRPATAVPTATDDPWIQAYLGLRLECAPFGSVSPPAAARPACPARAPCRETVKVRATERAGDRCGRLRSALALLEQTRAVEVARRWGCDAWRSCGDRQASHPPSAHDLLFAETDHPEGRVLSRATRQGGALLQRAADVADAPVDIDHQPPSPGPAPACHARSSDRPTARRAGARSRT